MKPFFIVFEGIDGAGKTSLIEKLFTYYKLKNVNISKFQEPTDYETGKKIREFLKGNLNLDKKDLLHLFIEDRKMSIEYNILPSLKKKSHVLLDRYYYSTCAYQAENELEALNLYKKFQSEYLIPDFLFFLDINPKLALKRLNKRENLDTFETLDYLEKVRKNYHSIFKEKPHTILNAEKSLEELFKEVLGKLNLN